MSAAAADRPLVAVLDYGIGNLRSAEKGLERAGADARLTTDHGLIADADAVVLPGVGAFGAVMGALRTADLEEPVHAAVQSGRPFLGICVGMQMLFEESEESPGVKGLGILPGRIVWLPTEVKRPQMQWNRLEILDHGCPLFTGLEGAWMYFVHSLAALTDPEVVTAVCDYGGTVTAAVGSANVWATQFHPEKSGQAGHRLLTNFVDHVRAER